jgi:ADP-ribose pyrophosphatase YjhB (NUDIX family)
MAKYVYGERIAKLGKLALTCAAVILDDQHERILLTRRVDNGRWCLPGGLMEAGESVEECCAREVWEETGLRVEITRLVGVYSNPHRLVEYADGNRWHYVNLCFEAKVIEGTVGLSDETKEYGYFTPAEIEQMDLIDPHHERIADLLMGQATAFVR